MCGDVILLRPGATQGGADWILSLVDLNDTGNPDTTHGGGHVYAVLAGHAIHPRTDAALMNHYSALAGVERAFGLPLLGHAHGATPVPF